MRFETEYDPGDPEQRKRWLKALDSVGVEGVRARLQQSPGGSASALFGIDTVPYLTRGFAEAWVEYHDRRARRRAQWWRWATIIVAVAGVSGVTLWPLIKQAWLMLNSFLPWD